MKVLFITPAIPSRYYGRRPFNMLQSLAAEHQFHVVAFSRDEKDPQFARALEEMGIRVTIVPRTRVRSLASCALGFPGPQPIRALYCRDSGMAAAVRDAASRLQPDLVHADRMRMGQYLEVIPGLPSVVDFTDALCLYLERKLALPLKPWERFVDARELRNTPPFERRLLERCTVGIVSGDLDAERMRADHPGRRIEVIENTVDADEFAPRSAGRPGEVLFVGSLFYYPNIDAVDYILDDIWPRVIKRLPDLRLRIGGAKPKPRVIEACRRHGVPLIPDIPDMAAVFHTEDVLLTPIRVASGTRFKLLEALSSGMGVVTNRLGAEGLPLEDGVHLRFGEDAGELAERTIELVRDDGLRRQLGEAGRALVRERYHRRTIARKLDTLYRSIVPPAAHQRAGA